MKYLKPLIPLLIIAVLIASGWLVVGNDNASPAYRTAKITRGNIGAVVSANGTLNPVVMVNVGTQVSGQVEHIYVKVNDQVTKGELLAEIDPSLLTAQIKQDESSLETARINDEQAARDLQRMRTLLAKDYVAKVDLEHAEQSYSLAKNSHNASKIQLDRDQVNLNYAKIYSPIDGTIISQDVTLGQTLTANFQTPNMFKIAGDLTQMKIDVNLPESDIGKIKSDMPVTFTVDAFPEREFTGKVDMVNLSPNSQQGVVTYTIVVSTENKDKALLPGMTAYVLIKLSEQKDVLRVPAAALRFVPPEEHVSGWRALFYSGKNKPVSRPARSNANMLYLLRSGVLAPVAITPGTSDDTYVEVSGPEINEGDVVVTGMTSGRER